MSPYFHDVVVEGDQVEVRGPFASYFVWRGEGPVLLVGGGSGVVPLMAILRHRRRALPEAADAARLLGSHPKDAIYADELGDDTELTYTRLAPPGWTGHTGRIDAGMLTAWASEPEIAFVCGSNGFVETATGSCSKPASPPERIRTERFGPTGFCSARRTRRSAAVVLTLRCGLRGRPRPGASTPALSSRQPSSVRRRFQ